MGPVENEFLKNQNFAKKNSFKNYFEEDINSNKIQENFQNSNDDDYLGTNLSKKKVQSKDLFEDNNKVEIKNLLSIKKLETNHKGFFEDYGKINRLYY
jgi:hypothetical protein